MPNQRGSTPADGALATNVPEWLDLPERAACLLFRYADHEAAAPVVDPDDFFPAVTVPFARNAVFHQRRDEPLERCVGRGCSSLTRLATRYELVV